MFYIVGEEARDVNHQSKITSKMTEEDTYEEKTIRARLYHTFISRKEIGQNWKEWTLEKECCWDTKDVSKERIVKVRALFYVCG